VRTVSVASGTSYGHIVLILGDRLHRADSQIPLIGHLIPFNPTESVNSEPRFYNLKVLRASPNPPSSSTNHTSPSNILSLSLSAITICLEEQPSLRLAQEVNKTSSASGETSQASRPTKSLRFRRIDQRVPGLISSSEHPILGQLPLTHTFGYVICRHKEMSTTRVARSDHR